MQLIEINSIEPQAPQTALACRAQMRGMRVAFPLAGSRPCQPAFGRNDQALRIWVQRFGNDLFTDVRSVGVSGIDEIHTELKRTPENLKRRLTVSWRTPHARTREPHRAEAEPMHAQICPDRH